jgi:hypothetical protein
MRAPSRCILLKPPPLVVVIYFDEVEIIRADEEEVERFAIQIGNDTDSVRKSRYNQMVCRISADCNLPSNALRILKCIFADIAIDG